MCPKIILQFSIIPDLSSALVSFSNLSCNLTTTKKKKKKKKKMKFKLLTNDVRMLTPAYAAD